MKIPDNVNHLITKTGVGIDAKTQKLILWIEHKDPTSKSQVIRSQFRTLH